jgi:cytochrome c-type biogenesis protein CcmH
MIRSLIATLAVALLLGGAPRLAWAVEPSEMLEDPILEQRARAISKQLRCLVCQNQSIDESDADLARDLRIIVREQLVAGKSNEEVIGFVVARYGDWVLLSPPLKTSTLVLWLGPLGIVGIAGLMYWGFFRRRHPFDDDADDTRADAKRQPHNTALKEG